MQCSVRCGLGVLLLSLAACSGPPPDDDAGDAEDGGPGEDAGGSADAGGPYCSGDDECDDGNFCNGRERCDRSAEGANAFGCAPPRARACMTSHICEEATDTCVTDCGLDRDADDDGVDAIECAGLDCDDADPTRFAGNVEVCDDEGRDEDCDPATFGARDLDRDGAVDARCCNTSRAGVVACGEDCDDTRRGVRPLGAEVCDGLDNDCNGSVDEGVTVAAFADADRDLHGDPDAPTMACAGAAGVSSVDDDCDDARRDAHGSQVEICDDLDNDCDEGVDEHARPVTWYRDLDGDGFGSGVSGTMVSCAPLEGYSLLPTDCDDTNRAISPLAVELCDGLDDDCDGLVNFRVGVNDLEDDDGDGHADLACGGTDCDDGDPSAYLGAPEICDFRDSDCDGLSDQGADPPPGVEADETVEVDGYADVDQDGWGASAGAIRSCAPQAGRVTRAGDCADADPTTHPGAVDRCDGHDDDCDGEVDEDVPDRAYYADSDLDGDGAGAPTLACAPPASLTELPGDCAPADPSRGPLTYETCNAIDDDCDGEVDEALFRDLDGDGFGDPEAPVLGACSTGDVGRSDDCNDAVDARNPDLAEICNLVDDDCDGDVDEAGAELCVAGDGHGMCVAGRCEFTCGAGMADCDGDPSNGCEADLARDPRRCGDCTTSCGVAATCGGLTGCDDPIVEIALGAYTACARRQGGRVMCWGTGLYLGNPTAAAAQPTPLEVVGVENATALAVSLWAACALHANGRVSCWGYEGASGELGHGGTALGYFLAREVPGIFDAVEIARTVSSTCVRHATGDVSCWGANGWPGDPDGVGPSRVVGVDNAVSLHGSGDWNLLIRTADGRLLHFGDNYRFGGGPAVMRDVTGVFPSLPRAVAINAYASLALLDDGRAVCWGTNLLESCGAAGDFASGPTEIAGTWDGAVEVVTVGSGAQTICARFPDGAVRCSGDCGGMGLRGDGCATAVAIGTTVTGLDGASPGDLDDAVDLDGALYDHLGRACAVRRRGDVVCWGTGLGGALDTQVPVRVVLE